MSIKRNTYLVLDVTNEMEGITLTIRTVAKGDKGVRVTGDVGLYDGEELLQALTEAKTFVQPEVKNEPQTS